MRQAHFAYNRHEIEPGIVKASVEKRVASNEALRVRLKANAAATLARYEQDLADGTAARKWQRAPSGPGYVDPMIDQWNARECEYYARVRIIELPSGAKRFKLVYGDQPDDGSEGTGPFATLQDAKDWFAGQGR